MKCKHGNIVKFHSMVKCARNETKSPRVSALFFHCFSLSLCVRRWDAEANLHNRQIHWGGSTLAHIGRTVLCRQLKPKRPTHKCVYAKKLVKKRKCNRSAKFGSDTYYSEGVYDFHMYAILKHAFLCYFRGACFNICANAWANVIVFAGLQ